MLNYAFLPNFLKKKKLRNIDYIFVDYFDTVAFRYIHSSQIYLQWGKILRKKFPELETDFTSEQLAEIRRSAIHHYSKKYEEPPYEVVIKECYKKITAIGKGKFKVSEKDFIRYSLDLDINLEVGCQYPNRCLIDFLRKEKQQGKKIFLVSDFYLPPSAYQQFFINLQCEGLFDKIYISEAHNKTKASGTLYAHILEENGLSPERIAMMGDSKHSDYRKSKENGLQGCWYFPLRHKLWTNYSRLTKWDFSKYATTQKMKYLYKHSLLGEYVPVWFFFITRLHQRAREMHAEELNFLSRGGFFLHKLFEIYQQLAIPEEQQLKATYFLNSRKVTYKARDAYENKPEANPDDYILLKEYLMPHCHNNRFFIVDEGWYNHTQQTMTTIYGLDTYGFYIGSCAKDPMPDTPICHREGILFDRNENGTNSPYYGVFCTNRSVYEQLLTAPEASVSAYIRQADGSITTKGTWDEREKTLYENYIAGLQAFYACVFGGLTTWCTEPPRRRTLAKVLLRSAIFNNIDRLQFLNQLEQNMVNNFAINKNQTKGLKDARIDFRKLLLHPEEYVGYIAKVQPRIYHNQLFNKLYYIGAGIFYLYVRTTLIFERKKS